MVPPLDARRAGHGRQGASLMLRLPPFRYVAPRSAREAARMLADHGPDAMAGGRRDRPLSEHEAPAVRAEAAGGPAQPRRGTRHPRQRRLATGRPRDAERCRGAPGRAGALARGRPFCGPRVVAAAAQRGHHRRQPVRRYALQLLQPDRVLARLHRLLHEEGRRHLPGGAGLGHLLGAQLLGHRAGDDRLGAEVTLVGPGRRAAPAGGGALRP